ncbi:MAG: hypothetical protein JW895_10285 [Thermoleophilaceae bacterium]|nr:hypothetical protein [Thermoleophilaceae bacterium]
MAERVLPSPGHQVTARELFRVYLDWARDREPEAPLAYGSFLSVLEDSAPIEQRADVRRGRGRPALAFVGITTSLWP